MSAEVFPQSSPKKRKAHEREKEKPKVKVKTKSSKEKSPTRPVLANGDSKPESSSKTSKRIILIRDDVEDEDGRVNGERHGSAKSKTKVKRSKKKSRDDEQTQSSQSRLQASPQRKSTSKGSKSKSEHRSAFHIQSSSIYVSLSPIAQSDPMSGICAEHLSPLLLTYYPPFSGIVLSYSNVRLSEVPGGSSTYATLDEARPVLAQSLDEYAVSFLWVTADFLVFRPEKKGSIDAYVNLHNESHLGLIFLNLFSVSVPREYLPKAWVWVDSDGNAEDRDFTSPKKRSREAEDFDGEGHWIGEDGQKVEGLIKLKIRDYETVPWSDHDKGFISIEGTLVEEDGDEKEKGSEEASGA